MTTNISFTPSPDTATLLNRLLDGFELRGGQPKRAVRVRLGDVATLLPGYYSQTDPTPRVVANEQLAALERAGWITLEWEPGQKGHLLGLVTLAAAATPALYALLKREPEAAQRRRLRDQLLADRFRVHDWRRLALDHTLAKLEAQESPAPFTLNDEDWNRDLLEALLALPENTIEELPYRVFSVRVFNDSKRFEVLARAVARLARRHHGEWRDLTNWEILHELGLVPNPSYLYLAGNWRLATTGGKTVSLADFDPAVGIPATLAARLNNVTVDAARVICVENLTSFYTLLQHAPDDLAALCLAGNPSPACRQLLACLAATLPAGIPLHVWADIDYGGLNILAQLRRHVSSRFSPYRMDIETLDAFARWGQPLTANDTRNLARLRDHPALADMASLIDEMLLRELKLEQEAIVIP